MNISFSKAAAIAGAALALALPTTSEARDDHHGGDHGHGDWGRHDHGDWRYSSGYGYRPYGYGYRPYGYGYGYGYRPYFGPSFGITYSTRPVYAYSNYSSDLAVDVQRELRRRGYYRGVVDGDIGPGSRAAIRAYQAHRDLPVTGRIDTPLLRDLDLD